MSNASLNSLQDPLNYKLGTLVLFRATGCVGIIVDVVKGVAPQFSSTSEEEVSYVRILIGPTPGADRIDPRDIWVADSTEAYLRQTALVLGVR